MKWKLNNMFSIPIENILHFVENFVFKPTDELFTLTNYYKLKRDIDTFQMQCLLFVNNKKLGLFAFLTFCFVSTDIK